MNFDIYVHGLWLLGAIFFFTGALMAGNIEWAEGTTTFTFGTSVFVSFVLVVLGSALFISAAVNAADKKA
ncbi:MAG: hypothetical protein V1802_00750 [Candidatus Aenigmatarchaeota archaeon]